MSKTIINVEGLSKSYRLGETLRYYTLRDTIASGFNSLFKGPRVKDRGDKRLWALKDVSFSVKEGEVLGIIGRNGAGKSTLLKVLSRITDPTEGTARIRGRLASLLEVGTGFHPELTGRENIFLNGAILGMTRREIRAKFDEIVAFAEIEKFLDTPVKRYSSGMYVRLAFAVAAHLDPEILIIDEVLAVGDAAFQKKCLGRMGDVSKSGRTVLFVSHNMAAVENLCGRSILLDKGGIVLDGVTETVIEKYVSGSMQNEGSRLKDRVDRKGSGRLRFTDIALRGSRGDVTDMVISGQDIAVELAYETDGREPLRNVSVSLGFYNSKGQFLFYCGNEMVGSPFESIGQSGRFKCLIPRFPLTYGRYFINVYCEVNGVLADWIQQAKAIDTIDGDFFHTGKLPPPSHGGLLVDHNWGCEEN